MINNRHGPHPAVSYYRSGAPPGCDVACNDNRLYEVEWERCARAAPVIPKIRDAFAALGDCFVENPFKRRGLKGYAEDAKNILCPEGFVALGDSLAHFAVSKRRGHKVELDPGNHRDAENAKKNLCSEGFATPWRTLRLNFLITELDMSYGSMMT